jgi:hypothetical protein
MNFLTQQLIVFGMASDPKPKEPFRHFNGKRAIVKTDSDHMVPADLLEMQ